MGTMLMPHEEAILVAMGKLTADKRALGERILKAAGMKKADIVGKFKNALILMDCRGYIRWSDAEGAYVVTQKGTAALEEHRAIKSHLAAMGL